MTVVKLAEAKGRHLANWVDGFISYTEGKGSPVLWRKWAAIYTLAAAVERKVWLRTAKGKLFPNMYVVLVGKAGTGKSLATNTVYELLRELAENANVHLAPTSVTKASLIDALDGAERKIIRPMATPPIFSFNSLSIVVNELGVFLPAYDGEFMNTLTDLWDCKNYSETRRTNKININIPSAQLNMFSATTPTYLNGFLPEGAWEHGFMARVLMVYSGAADFTDMFAEFEFDSKLWNNLVDDLKSVNQMVGELIPTDEVKEAINAWARSGGAPQPSHPKLADYLTRRPAHLLKLCQIACVASGSGYEITLDHFAEALDWLAEMEHAIPDIFKAMKTGGDGKVIEEAYHFIYEIFIKDKNKNPVLEHRLFHFLQERTPAHNVARIIDVMERAKLIEKKFAEGGIGYVPKSKMV